MQCAPCQPPTTPLPKAKHPRPGNGGVWDAPRCIAPRRTLSNMQGPTSRTLRAITRYFRPFGVSSALPPTSHQLVSGLTRGVARKDWTPRTMTSQTQAARRCRRTIGHEIDQRRLHRRNVDSTWTDETNDGRYQSKQLWHQQQE